MNPAYLELGLQFDSNINSDSSITYVEVARTSLSSVPSVNEEDLLNFLFRQA